MWTHINRLYHVLERLLHTYLVARDIIMARIPHPTYLPHWTASVYCRHIFIRTCVAHHTHCIYRNCLAVLILATFRLFWPTISLILQDGFFINQRRPIRQNTARLLIYAIMPLWHIVGILKMQIIIIKDVLLMPIIIKILQR